MPRRARAPAGLQRAQMELLPEVAAPGAERAPVTMRAWQGRLLLCGPELGRYMSRVKKLRAPKFDTQHVQAHYDCLAETAPLSDLSMAAQRRVADKLLKAGVPVQIEIPRPQSEGPLRWSAPDQWGVITSDLVEFRGPGRGGYYQISPTEKGRATIWLYYPGAGSGTPALTLANRPASPDEEGGEVPNCSSVARCQQLAERHLELVNQQTGFAYEDYDRGRDGVVQMGLIRWRGGGRSIPPLPEPTFYDAMLFSSREAAIKEAKRRHTGLIGPTVPVKARPIRVYRWDALTDDRLKAPTFQGQREHGAWALTPDGKALLTRWAKNAPLKQR